MASFLTDTQKTEYNSVLDDLHDTFSISVTGYKDPIVKVTSSNNSYNSIYGNAGPTQSKTFSPQSFTLQARIMYGHKYDEEYISDGKMDSQVKATVPAGRIRVKIKGSDLPDILEAKRIEFFDSRFAIDSDIRGHGLFSVNNFYTFFAKYAGISAPLSVRITSKENVRVLSNGDVRIIS